MFRAQSAHHQEVNDANCTYAVSGIVTHFFIITNFMHKFLFHSHKLRKIKLIYMFGAQSAHHQEVNDANCTYAASGIVTLCK